MDPFFSIVLVNYNHGSFLEDAIFSITSQDCNDYELIIVDGGSTDHSKEIIEKYKNILSWWVSEEDTGQSNAFNKGFSHAKGKFYFWLNADDLLFPHTLKKAKEYLLSNPSCKWLTGNTITLDVNRKIKWCIRGPVFVSPLIKKGTVYVYGPSSFFHKELFKQSGGFDESLHYTMDTDLWYRFVNMGYKFKRLNHYCWAFRIHAGSKTSHSITDKPNEKFISEAKYIQKKNNHPVYKSVEFCQFLFKVITGCFLIRWWDTRKLSGKYI